MKVVITALGLLLVSSAASAGQLNCSGNYLWIKFEMRARTSAATVVGNINVDVRGAPGGQKTWVLSPTSSDLKPAQYVRFSATSPNGGGDLLATWDGQAYRGTMRANTSYGSANVDVSCRWSERSDRRWF